MGTQAKIRKLRADFRRDGGEVASASKVSVGTVAAGVLLDSKKNKKKLPDELNKAIKYFVKHEQRK